MAKENLKKKKWEEQNGRALNGKELPEDTKLYDTHRFKPKAKGGKYTDDNFNIIAPEDHFKIHGIWKDHGEFEELKSLLDDFRKVQQQRLRAGNQLLALERGVDILNPETKIFLENQQKVYLDYEKTRISPIAKWLKEHGKDNPFITSVMSVKFVGPILAACLLIDIDITKCLHPSSLWKYYGYAGSSLERYPEKGEAGGGRKQGRATLYVWSVNIVKGERFGSPYADVYRRRKMKTENSKKLTKHRYKGKTYEVEWCNNDIPGIAGHRDMDGRRIAIKYFLADLWFVWRTLAGLSTTDLYVKEHLGHESAIINPKERGWEY